MSKRAGGTRTVQFGWGRAFLAPACVDESRTAVLECRLRSLSAVFGVSVNGLPRVGVQSLDEGGSALETQSLSSDDSEGGLPADAMPMVWDLSLVRSLTLWLEEAALHPEPRQRDELLDVAVLLSSLVRTRTELVRLRGEASSPQLDAERRAADAVRIHLGLLERLSAPPAAAVRPGGPSEACGPWHELLDRFAAAAAECARGQGSAKVGGHGRLTAWRNVRPGAKLVDTHVEEAAPAPAAAPPPQVRVLTAADRTAPLHSVAVHSAAALPRSAPQQVVHRHHRSPSPPLRLSSGPAVQCVWPAPLPAPGPAAAPAALQGSSSSVASLASLGRLHLCSSVATLGLPQAVATQAVAAPAPQGPSRFISAGPAVRLSPSPSDPVSLQLAAARSQTPIITRQPSCGSTRWVSPTIVRRATTPMPVRPQRQCSVGVCRVAEVPAPVQLTPPKAAPEECESDSDEGLARQLTADPGLCSSVFSLGISCTMHGQ